MKMRENNTNVIRTEDFQESYFGIDNDEDLVHIFNILRSKIYTDKVKAVVREYSTNAQDAHIEAGTPDRPIEVSLPSKFSPEFSVRDFGPGLTEEAVRTIYVKYGKSTKRNSNDFNGQLGLGCKAGFAYGDSFLITSYKDGVERNFEAYIDETKIGKVAKLSEKETDQPNGVKITIPVKPQDVNAFVNTAQSFYRYFSPTPNVPGISLEPVKYAYSGTGWGIEANSNYRGYGRWSDSPVAVMGNVVYPVDMAVVQKNTPRQYWDQIRNIANVAVVMTFDIGVLGISSSREGLEYDKETVKAIVERLQLTVKEMTAELEKEFDNIPDIFTARAKYREFFMGYDKNIVAALVPNASIQWRGHTIDRADFSWPFKKESIHVTGAIVEEDGTKQSGVSQRRLSKYNRWTHTDKTVYVINDATDRWILRLRNYFEQNPSKDKAIVVKFDPSNEKTKAKWHELLSSTLLEEKHFIKLSAYDPLKIKRAPGVRLPKHKAKVFEFNCTMTGHRTGKSDAWVVSDADIKKPTGSYVVLDRFVPKFNGHSLTNRELTGLLNSCFTLFGVDLQDDLIGVKTAISEKVGKTWPKLETKIKELFEEKMKDPKICNMLAVNSMVGKYCDSEIIEFIWEQRLWESMEPEKDTLIGEVFTMLEELYKFQKKSGSLINAVNTVSKHLNLVDSVKGAQEAKVKEIKEKFQALESRYPMMVHALTYSRPSSKDIQDYMALVDSRSDNNA